MSLSLIDNKIRIRKRTPSTGKNSEGVTAYFDWLKILLICNLRLYNRVNASANVAKTSHPIDKSRWRVARVCNTNSGE